jgi:hypothetical protein
MTDMKFLCYTLGDPSVPIPEPTPEDYQRLGEYMEEANKAGIILATGGVADLNEGVKLSYHNGDFTVLDGPFTEAKELVGGWALIETRDQDEAVEWTKRFLVAVGDGDATIRQVFGP